MFNQANLIGRVGRDPEGRHTAAGMMVVNISLATDYKKRSGDKMTTWHRLVAFDKTAELLAEYVKKGDKLHVTGRINSRKYKTKEGEEREVYEVVVENFTLLESKDGPRGQAGVSEAPTNSGTQEQKAAATSPQQETFDDDIPF